MAVRCVPPTTAPCERHSSYSHAAHPDRGGLGRALAGARTSRNTLAEGRRSPSERSTVVGGPHGGKPGGTVPESGFVRTVGHITDRAALLSSAWSMPVSKLGDHPAALRLDKEVDVVARAAFLATPKTGAVRAEHAWPPGVGGYDRLPVPLRARFRK